jgi:hypothetical protein
VKLAKMCYFIIRNKNNSRICTAPLLLQIRQQLHTPASPASFTMD